MINTNNDNAELQRAEAAACFCGYYYKCFVVIIIIMNTNNDNAELKRAEAAACLQPVFVVLYRCAAVVFYSIALFLCFCGIALSLILSVRSAHSDGGSGGAVLLVKRRYDILY